MKKPSIHIGLDVHKQVWQVSAVKQEQEVESFKLSKISKWQEKAKYLDQMIRKKFPGQEIRSGYENGPWGRTLHDSLTKLGWKNKVINGTDIKRSHKDRNHKNDKRDAFLIASQLGSLKGTFLHSLEHEEFKKHVKQRGNMVQQQSKLKVRFRNRVLQEGISWNGNSSDSSRQKLIYDLKAEDHHVADLNMINSQIRVYDFDISSIESDLVEYANKPPYAYYYDNLTSIDGVGFVLATEYVAYYGIVSRFTNFDRFLSYSGLIPKNRQSGYKSVTRDELRYKRPHIRSVYELTYNSLMQFNEDYKGKQIILSEKGSRNIKVKICKTFAKDIYPLWQAT